MYGLQIFGLALGNKAGMIRTVDKTAFFPALGFLYIKRMVCKNCAMNSGGSTPMGGENLQQRGLTKSTQRYAEHADVNVTGDVGHGVLVTTFKGKIITPGVVLEENE